MTAPRFSRQPPQPKSVDDFVAAAGEPRPTIFPAPIPEPERGSVDDRPEAPPANPAPSASASREETGPKGSAAERRPWEKFKRKGPARHQLALRVNDYLRALLEHVYKAEAVGREEDLSRNTLLIEILLPELEARAGVKRPNQT